MFNLQIKVNPFTFTKTTVKTDSEGKTTSKTETYSVTALDFSVAPFFPAKAKMADAPSDQPTREEEPAEA